MSPGQALVPDGPQNLLDAMAVATTPGACGVLVVCAGEVHGARCQVQKSTHTGCTPSARAKSGPLGWGGSGHLRWAENFMPNQPLQATPVKRKQLLKRMRLAPPGRAWKCC